MPRRRHLLALLPLPAILAGRAGATSAWVPDRPIRLVAPFPAGGASDLIARMVAEEVGPTLGQAVVVENRSGAGGSVGTEAVVRARPDGTTLLMGSQATHATNPALNRLSFEPMTDLTAIAAVCGVPAVLVVHPSVPAKNVAELVALAKARPDEISFGSAGIGASTHLSAALFAHLAGIRMQHVPYRGTAPATQDLLAGRIQMMMDTLPTALPHIQAGRLRALGVSTTARTEAMPDLPTLAEAGVAGYESLNWYGVFAPAGTPAPAIARLGEVIAAAVARPRFQARLQQQGMLPLRLTGTAFADYAAADRRRWTDLVKAANISAND